MAARKRKIRHDDETRAKIKAAALINRLFDHAMGNVVMDGPQVSSAKALLNKVLPDLTSVDMQSIIEQTVVEKIQLVPFEEPNDGNKK